MSEFVDLLWLGLLAASAGWSSFFSMFNRPHIRGWRNLGLLAGFMLGIAMLVALPWQNALVTWTVAGLTGGILYLTYEVVAYLRLPERTRDARPKMGVLIHGLLLWPVMLPEAVEYLLTELGVLKAPPQAPGGA